MNILQILPELNVGGVETGTLDFAKYLVNNGYRSIVVSNGGVLVDSLENAGSKHYTLPVHKKNIFKAPKLIKQLRQIIVEEKIDIVHARSRVPAWIAFFACQKTQAEFITTCHGYYKSRWTSQVMGWSKLVIVPSSVIGRHMIEDFCVDSNRIRCIARSVDLKKFQCSLKPDHKSAHPVIAIIGRITPLKGHEYFLKAMAKVLRQYPTAKIWVVGDAPKDKQDYRTKLEVLVKRLGIEKQVEFLGSRKDVPELLCQIDCVVMSSTEPESFGRVIVEAQAAEVPVVATKVGGVIDIIDHERTGLLVMPKDTEEMADQVLRVIKDKAFAEQLARHAYEKLQREYTVDIMSSRTLAVYEELLKMHSILILKLSSIGDVVLVTASIKAIRDKFPKAYISCVVGKESYPILKDCPYLDEVISYDFKDGEKGWIRFWKLTRRLRKQKFDQIIDFQNNRRSHLLSFLSFPRDSYGYDNKKWGKLLRVRVKNDQENLAPVAHQFKILNKLGIEYDDHRRLELWPKKEDEAYIEKLFESEWLANSKTVIGMNLSASLNWQTKNWPVEHLARLCDMLAAKNIRVVITGTANDKMMYEELIKKCKSKPASFVGRTSVLQLAALMKKCQIFITPDSAPMHIAAAMQTPFIAFFGPTDSARHVPPADKYIILEKKLNCAPCYKGRCQIFTHACMKDIKPEDVLREVEGLLGEKT